METIPPDLVERLERAVNRQRLLDTAAALVAVPSRTGEAGAALDRLAELLAADGFAVERPAGGHPAAPAVAVRLDSGRPGRTLQYNGHLDTVHLPFVPPAVDGGRLTGSGASDMKGGTAAAVEALRALRDAGLPQRGAVLLTAHDLHEAPWGLGQQLDRLIAEGLTGDGVLLPEPLSDRLPTVGRGGAVWKASIRRPGPPVHEVMRPDEPSVIAAGAELVARLARFGEALAARADPQAGCETVFVGEIHAGEIYNQYPRECRLSGTRRWLPGRARAEVERELRGLLAGLERETGTTVTAEFIPIRDAFRLDTEGPLVAAFQQACAAVRGAPLPLGPKPFIDDGNSFYALANVPAITHGPEAGGQHTVNEWVSIDDLVRVARLYARTALLFC
ncbi:MAG TPA: M20/M25/M40 family metallo-hydrolase [Gemmataceae bacterium]|jgi:acetylornithine deacetylase/succinyl-diaminopimelate desuccinylase-like protein|nr:M20/M25/M40 family metallo-hydrolase [Gemmataceae bacterium]